MDTAKAEAAVKNFNGGVIFLSYVISVIGAQTTLELFTRRTHIRGIYNWFLLTAASFVMGAVSIWSMHFIGNNSLELRIGSESHQLVYNAGYTFASLVVAVACMFIAFIFVGITEDAKLIRIIPSGIFAGLGIACMHYMGQFAVEYFILVYRTDYIVGAIIIACVAVTIALYIFFKLRERWMNQWYKRLGCALLMALAVCGMHYTGLVGTDFYRPSGNSTVPVPKIQEPALIGITSAVTVCCCIGLLYISVRAGIKTLPKYINKKNNKMGHRKRLFLNAVLFDPSGRVLVKVDGTLPMTEIVHHLEWIYHSTLNASSGSAVDYNHDRLIMQQRKKQHQEFNTSHPLFTRLLQTSIEKASAAPSHRLLSIKRPSGSSSSTTSSTSEIYDTIEKDFLAGWRNLKDELRLQTIADLGILSDIVITTDTVATPPSQTASNFTLFEKNGKGSVSNNRNSSATSWSKVDVIDRFMKAANAYNDTFADDRHVFGVSDRHHSDNNIDGTHYRHQPYDEENINHHLRVPKRKRDRFIQSTVLNKKKHQNESTSTSTTTTTLSKKDKTEDEETVLESSYNTTSDSGISHGAGTKNTVFRDLSANASFDDIMYSKEEESFSLDNVDGEDKHIFLVRKLFNEQDAQRLLAQGYRFADAVFIAKTMAVKLRIPTETMRHHFTDMLQLANSLQNLTQSQKAIPRTAGFDASTDGKPTLNPTIFRASTRPTVQMGAFVLLDESHDLTDIQILVEKARRYTFPLVQLALDDDDNFSTLNDQEVELLNRLKGRSLYDFVNLKQTLLLVKEEEDREAAANASNSVKSHSSNEQVEHFGDEKTFPGYSSFDGTYNIETAAAFPTVRPSFIRALQTAAQTLINSSSYSKALFQSSRLAMHNSSSSTVLDLPSFAITTGPCQLICFTCFVTASGAAAAVNYTFTETLKAIPLSLYRPLCGYITDQAAAIYKKSKLLQPFSSLPSSYLLLQQQQLYNQPTAIISSEAIPLETLGNENDIDVGVTTSAEAASSTADNSSPISATALTAKQGESELRQQSMPSALDDIHVESTPVFSLPPPPRLKKNNRLKLANALLNTNGGTAASDSNDNDGSNANLSATTATAAAYVLHHKHSRNFLDDTPLTVLTTQDRFWWINSVVENTIHNSH